MSDSLTFEHQFDLQVHSLTSIKKACYRYSGHFEIQLSLHDAGKSISVKLTAKKTVPFAGPDPRSLPNEVLDQDLREHVASETQLITELILAQAFSNLSLTDPVGESADPEDDPLEITRRDRVPKSN